MCPNIQNIQKYHRMLGQILIGMHLVSCIKCDECMNSYFNSLQLLPMLNKDGVDFCVGKQVILNGKVHYCTEKDLNSSFNLNCPSKFEATWQTAGTVLQKLKFGYYANTNALTNR